MIDDLNYQLTRRLDALVDDAGEAATKAIEDVDREASLIGRDGNNAYCINSKNSAARNQFRNAVMELTPSDAAASSSVSSPRSARSPSR